MSESNMVRSKVGLQTWVVERHRGSSVGLKFDVAEFKDLQGGVSPSQLTPPEASGSASSSSAAALTAAASTAAAPTAVQATTPKFMLPSPRGVPGLPREPMQVSFSRSACRDLPRSTRRMRLRRSSSRRSLQIPVHEFQVATQLCQALSGSARILAFYSWRCCSCRD